MTLEPVHGALGARVSSCGNPEMAKDSRRILVEHRYRVSRRGGPGHIAVENYW